MTKAYTALTGSEAFTMGASSAMRSFIDANGTMNDQGAQTAWLISWSSAMGSARLRAIRRQVLAHKKAA